MAVRILYLAQLEQPRPRQSAVTIGNYRFEPSQITEIPEEEWAELKKDVSVAHRLEWGAFKEVEEEDISITPVTPETDDSVTTDAPPTPPATPPKGKK